MLLDPLAMVVPVVFVPGTLLLEGALGALEVLGVYATGTEAW